MDARYRKVLIKPNVCIREALKQMNEAALQVLVVVDEENRIVGIITDGDVRRSLLDNIPFDEPIEKIMNRNPITLRSPYKEAEALELMKKNSIKHIPVINEKQEVVDIILWGDFLNNGKIKYPSQNIPVVIMAGGKGTRLDPFTKILPKPLIPIGDKPVIEIIMERFSKYGFNKFIISLNYKGEMIKTYFLEKQMDYHIEYVEEKEFLSTSGALSLMQDKLKNTFVVSNCDIITDANFESLLKYHKDKKNKATILAIIRNVKIPYGVLKIQDGDLEEILEKPEYSFIINAGIYVLEPDIIKLIPKEKPTNMTDLLTLAKEKGMKVSVYTVNCSWFDIGEWEEYKRAVEFIDNTERKSLGGL
jgi:dTDP-glucose pyrophosphorylase